MTDITAKNNLAIIKKQRDDYRIERDEAGDETDEANRLLDKLDAPVGLDIKSRIDLLNQRHRMRIGELFAETGTLKAEIDRLTAAYTNNRSVIEALKERKG